MEMVCTYISVNIYTVYMYMICMFVVSKLSYSEHNISGLIEGIFSPRTKYSTTTAGALAMKNSLKPGTSDGYRDCMIATMIEALGQEPP